MEWFVYGNCLMFIVAYMVVVFLLAQWLKNNSIVDVFWGLGFVLMAVFLFIKIPSELEYQFWQTRTIVSAVVLIWGIRLASHIAFKNWGQSEDWRYVNFRNEWREKGIPQWIGALLQVFLLQGFFMFVIALPIIHIHLSSASPGFFVWLGLLLWVVGFYFEAVGDYQKQQFKNNPANKGEILTTGLWKYTRHPNYFGESLMWWGIWMMSIQFAHPWWTLIGLLSPVILSWLLIKVSGVAMLERKYTHHPAYQAYIRHTPAFFPKFHK